MRACRDGAVNGREAASAKLQIRKQNLRLVDAHDEEAREPILGQLEVSRGQGRVEIRKFIACEPRVSIRIKVGVIPGIRGLWVH